MAEMRTRRRRAGAVAAALAGLLTVAALAFFGTRAHAEPLFNIAGHWKFDFATGTSTFRCSASATQSDYDFTIVLDCSGQAASFAGTIDPNTGLMTATGELAGSEASLTGTVSADGVRGSWMTSSGSSGSFSAVRGEPTPTPSPSPTPGPLDLPGDWLLTMSTTNLPPPGGSGHATCLVFLEQAGTDVAGAVSCPPFGTTRLRGTVDPMGEAFSLSWTLSIGSFSLDGASSSGNRSIQGTYIFSAFPDIVNAFGMQGSSDTWWGSLVCVGPTPIGPFIPPPVTNRSLAALSILQSQARVAQSAPRDCIAFLDVNADGSTDARDAMLILQREAGLIPRLPVL